MFDEELKSTIKEIAKSYELEAACLMAVVEVESGGKLGSRVNGRVEPLIRFEGHYFYRLLPIAKRNLAVVRGLASPRPGKVKNPWRQASRWQLLKRAEQIDRPAALASCSWGCGQVMGSHWRWLGYASIDALVFAARDGANGQISLMMRYVKKAGLVEKLQTQDWAGFARGYNGPSYKKYKYDTKLSEAYNRYSVMYGKTTMQKFPARNSMHLLKFGSTGESVRLLQKNLSSLGFFLIVDGDFGSATERMVKAFQRENRLKVDGIFGPKSFTVMARRLPQSSFVA